MNEIHDISTLPLSRNSSGTGILLAALALLGLGTVMVYSASANLAVHSQWYNRQEIRHIGYAVVAAILMFTVWRVDYRWLYRSRFGYGLIIGAMVLSILLTAAVMVHGVGMEKKGAHRWLPLGLGLTFQPSELLKLISVIFLACWLGQPQRDTRSFTKAFLPAMAITLISVGAVVKEGFSLATIIGLTLGAVLLLSGIRWYYLFMLIPPAAAAAYFLVMRNPMRLGRITAFQHVWDASSATTYQARQSLIAIGSGGLWGKGIGNGALKLGFLPEANNDFIFAVLCEELGFFGAALLISLVAVILFLSWRIAARSKDRTGRILAGGMGVLIVVQALLHIAVNISAAPPTGTCLPLVSAGGTDLILGAISIAMIVSVSAHQDGDELLDGRRISSAARERSLQAAAR